MKFETELEGLTSQNGEVYMRHNFKKQWLCRRWKSISDLTAFQGKNAEFTSTNHSANYPKLCKSWSWCTLWDIEYCWNDPVRTVIETVHKSWHTGLPVVKWTNPSTKDISLPIVVRLGSGLLEILDVIVPGLVVLSGDGKEKKN